MFKNLSYLAIVSILASTFAFHNAYAEYVDHEKIMKVIKKYYDEKEAEKNILPNQKISQEEKSTAQSVLDTVSSVISGSVTSLGTTLRYLGGQLRGDTFTRNLLVKKGLEYANGANVGCMPCSDVISELSNDNRTCNNFCKTAGNAMRNIGKHITGETRTLARDIRQLYIDHKAAGDPENAFINITCALQLSTQHIKSVDHVSQAYRDIVESWNGGSYTTPSEDSAMNETYFLSGIVKAYVFSEKPLDDKFTQLMLALNVDLAKLPSTKDITETSVMKKFQSLQASEIKSKVEEERTAAFLNYAQDVYKFQSQKHEANKYRNENFTPITNTNAPKDF